MRRKLLFVILAVLMVVVIVTPALAGGAQFRSVFHIGSLESDGYGTGLSNDTWALQQWGSAIPFVTCYAPGSGNPAPGQNPPKLNSPKSGVSLIPSNTQHNGKSTYPTLVTPNPDASGLPASQMGCANDNWTYSVAWWNWTNATVQATDLNTGQVLTYNYACVTTGPDRNDISCTLLK